MKVYPITSNQLEDIELKVGDENYTLVHRVRRIGTQELIQSKAIIMNKRELLKLYQAIQEEVLN